MSRAQMTVDGYSVNFNRARFSGTIDLEDKDAPFFGTDEIVVGVFVANVVGPQFTVIKKTGDITRTAVTKVSEVRILEGKLKEVLVKQLGLSGTDTLGVALKAPVQPVLNPGTLVPTSETVSLEDEDDLPEEEDDIFSPPEVSDLDDEEDDEDVDDEDIFVPTQTEVVGSIRDYAHAATPQPTQTGPRALPFGDEPQIPQERAVVARVKPSKDKALKSFLSDVR